MSKSKCVRDSRGADKSMRFNLRQHAKSNDNSPSQDKILKSNFLFSLTPQKHSVGETRAATARSLSFKVQNVTKVHGPQVDKAWQALSRLNLSSRSYIKPDKSLPWSKDGNIDSFQNASRATKQCSSNAKNSSMGSTWADQYSNDIYHKLCSKDSNSSDKAKRDDVIVIPDDDSSDDDVIILADKNMFPSKKDQCKFPNKELQDMLNAPRPTQATSKAQYPSTSNVKQTTLKSKGKQRKRTIPNSIVVDKGAKVKRPNRGCRKREGKEGMVKRLWFE